MTAADFRRIALSLEGVEEYSHAGLPAFRVGGRKFASLASQAGRYGNLMLTLEQQAAFVEEAPEVFLPIPGGWGKMGHTHVRLAANEDVLAGALRTAWKLRINMNAKTSRKSPPVARRSGVTDKKRGKRPRWEQHGCKTLMAIKKTCHQNGVKNYSAHWKPVLRKTWTAMKVDMNIVGAFMKRFPWCQRDFFSALHLHHDDPLQHIDFQASSSPGSILST
jgi:hypothetical protein